MNSIERELIVSICKKVPAMLYPESTKQWFNAIHEQYNISVQLKPEIACQLTFIWLQQNKNILIQNLESALI